MTPVSLLLERAVAHQHAGHVHEGVPRAGREAPTRRPSSRRRLRHGGSVAGGRVSVVRDPRPAPHRPRRWRHRPALLLPRARRLRGVGGDRPATSSCSSTSFEPRYRLKHLEWEEADEVEDIRHPLLREALAAPLERRSRWRSHRSAEAPPGTGLGSSGAYTVARSRRCAWRGSRELARRAGRGGLRGRDRAGSAAPWASRTSTRPPTAACAPTLQPRRHRGRPRARPGRRGAPQPPRATSSSSTRARPARRRTCSPTRSPHAGGRRRGQRQPPPRQGAGPGHLRRARGGRPRALRRADGRALGAQALASAGRGDRARWRSCASWPSDRARSG